MAKTSTLKSVGSGIVGVAATLSLTYLACTPREPKQNNPPNSHSIDAVIQEKPSFTKKDLVDSLEVCVDDDKPFTLKHDGNGIYSGRQNELIGSKVVEIAYGFEPRSSRVRITIEGSPFAKPQGYASDVEKILEKGEYEIVRADGKKVTLKINHNPFPINGDAFDFMRMLSEGMSDSMSPYSKRND